MLLQRLTCIANEAYPEEDWHIMESAHGIASFDLQRSMSTDCHAARLAGEIMRLFNTGEHDINRLAALAAGRERIMVL
ncbi:hypothetical protein GF108_12560 [Phyllobacterium sp. SYP-B3895]|uniref:hypothetical protein n=1 Tax=Phyllobacterium sp. SYP-B3895 TaxID=2663240 RepID=UPI0012997EF1|nr:hypothetical protein [Phyllobacterium sp. SYP-B3895]MRG56409.1 hypothetical protein [Phyllobacterium sp. SYP-B3895]